MSTKREYDVIICGGGPAGIAAAIAASRAGAKTLLIEKNPFAGGTWTAGSMCIVIDHVNKKGIMSEIRKRLETRWAWEPWHGGSFGLFTVEEMKRLLDEMLMEANVTLRYHTFLFSVRTEGRLIRSISTVSKSGVEEWQAQIFIDATGDGDLGALAGCGFDKGREQDGKMQPGTMFGLVGGWHEPLPKPAHIIKILDSAGYPLSYRGLTLFAQPYQHGIAFLMASHIYGLDSTSADSLTWGEIEGRRQVYNAVECLRKHGGKEFADIFVISTGPFVSVREGRRIHGLYTLTAEDARRGQIFDDGVCEVTFNFDVHDVTPEEGKHLWHEIVPPYQIPYRSLVAKDVDNLLLAGRCISGDFIAHSSYRVTGNAVTLGQVAGLASAIACQECITPAQVDPKKVSQLANRNTDRLNAK